jgi:hypothetical protein
MRGAGESASRSEPEAAWYSIGEIKMNESRLNDDLKALSERLRPDVPSNFNAMVWSKIQSREARSLERCENWFKAFPWVFPTPTWAAAALALAVLGGWVLGRITTGRVASPTETKLAASVTGEVLDLACYYADGASGPSHAACARRCIASGLPVGLKAKDGTIYLLIGKETPPSSEPAGKHILLNAQLAPYAAKIVTMSGTIVRRNGLNVLENAELCSEEALSHQSPDFMTDLETHFTHFLEQQLASAVNPHFDCFHRDTEQCRSFGQRVVFKGN